MTSSDACMTSPRGCHVGAGMTGSLPRHDIIPSYRGNRCATGTGAAFFEKSGSRIRTTRPRAALPRTAACPHRPTKKSFGFAPPLSPAAPGTGKPKTTLLFRTHLAKITPHNEKGLDNALGKRYGRCTVNVPYILVSTV